MEPHKLPLLNYLKFLLSILTATASCELSLQFFFTAALCEDVIVFTQFLWFLADIAIFFLR